ncbi:MAG: DUF4249 domain-containing protein [Bacteroidia bacterium]|nr:DUF4249 domain-containing protein [Bacteroidia bacterium]
MSSGKNSLSVLLISLFVLLLVACEREITIKLPDADNKITVEGYIENDSFPVVILTKSLPYFQSLDLNNLNDFFVKGAKVEVVVDNDTVPLQEFTASQPGGNSFTIYTNPFLIGQAGKTYTLLIESEGQKLSAVTTIPDLVPLDSFSFEKVDSTNTIFLPEGHDSLYRLLGYFRDPAGQTDYYRYWTSRASMKKAYEGALSPYTENGNSAFKFDLFDGQYVNGFWIQGSKVRGDSLADHEEYFKLGDTISVKWGTIDKAQYEFWDTYINNLNGSGPFSPPIIVKTNVKGGNGIWAGTSASYYTNIIVK